MFAPSILAVAEQVLAAARSRNLHLSTAKTVTAGLVSAAITSASGASEVFERGFVLYGYEAKSGGLDIPSAIAKTYGAVSAEITKALTEAVFEHSHADISVAVTGYAGPGGGSPDKPVGTVFIAAARRSGPIIEERYQFQGDRDAVRLAAVQAALELVLTAIEA